MIVSAPMALAASILTRPMGPLKSNEGHVKDVSLSMLPAPVMNTFDPIVTPARRQAWTPTLNGSQNAPSSYVTWSGNLSEYRFWRRKHYEKSAFLLETKISRMRMVTCDTSVNWWCGKKNNIGAKIITTSSAEITSTTRYTWFDGNTVTLKNEYSFHTRLIELPFIKYLLLDSLHLDQLWWFCRSFHDQEPLEHEQWNLRYSLVSNQW